VKPYYEHAGITIYHGDCREALPQLEVESIITDPVWPNCEHIFPGIDAGELLGQALRAARGVRGTTCVEAWISSDAGPHSGNAVERR
jgi:hypothetical protein